MGTPQENPMSKQNTSFRYRKTLLILACAVAAGIIPAFFIYHQELSALWVSFYNGHMSPGFLLVSFLCLPVVGFPIFPFLVLLGIQFGSLTGSVILLLMVPVHLTIAFWVTHTFLRDLLKRLVRKSGLNIPNVPDTRRLKYSFVFMAVPGVSYSLKNYLLPLSGMPFVPFLFCGWVTQALFGIPLVVLGDAASQYSIPIFIGCISLVLIGFLFKKWIIAYHIRRSDASLRKIKKADKGGY